MLIHIKRLKRQVYRNEAANYLGHYYIPREEKHKLAFRHAKLVNDQTTSPLI